MVITLFGDDNSRLSARLRALVEEYAPGDLATFNLLELDGAEVTLPDLRSVCDALPFLGDRRVVIVKGLLGRFADKDAEDSGTKGASPAAAFAKELKAYLPQVPESTVLVFVERRKLGSSAVANALRSGGTVEDFSLPTGDGLAAYIERAVSANGGSIEHAAASLLAAAVADDPSRLEPELDKLLAYSGGDGQVTVRDVRELVEIPIEVAVWDLTDAMYSHDAAAAVLALRTLLERGQPGQQVMGAVASQIRNLVVAEEHRGASPEKLATATGMKPFVARKSVGALRNFKPGEPGRILNALRDLDLRTKTGKAELNSALEFLVVDACARRL